VRLNKRTRRLFEHLPQSPTWALCAEQHIRLFLDERNLMGKFSQIHVYFVRAASHPVADASQLSVLDAADASQLSDCDAVTLQFTLKHTAAPAGSVRAWHGTQLHHVKAILTSGRLRDSTPETGRTLHRRDGAALSGVYLHDDLLSHKALGYAYWVSPWADGLFCKCYFEVRAAPGGRVPLGGRRTDQLIYAADAVTLTALWVSVQPIRNIPKGEGVYTCWNAQDETVAAPNTVASQHGAKIRLRSVPKHNREVHRVFKQHLKQQQKQQQQQQQHSSLSQGAPKTRPSTRPPVEEVVPPNPQESQLAQQQHVDRVHQCPADAVAAWVNRVLPRLQGKNQHNFARILQMAWISPDQDFAGVVEIPYSIAPKRGVHYYRIFTAENRGWQRASMFDVRPGCQYYSGGHGTTDVGLLGILRDRALKPFQYPGVYGYLTEGAYDPVWGAHSFKECMEKVASGPKNWAGVVIEVRCRGVSERINGGVPAECEAVSRQGVIAHASKSNGGRWLMPVPFIDLIGLWVPLHGFCGDTLPGCLTPIPGLAAG